jgi:predicted phosphodiesterase
LTIKAEFDIIKKKLGRILKNFMNIEKLAQEPRIGLISDLHLAPRAWDIAISDMLPASGSVDVMILLGDIGPYNLIPDICRFVQDALECEVLFIPGNHDYYSYGTSIASMSEIQELWVSGLAGESKIHVLIDSSWDYQGLSFFGSTWWSNMGSQVDRELFRLSESAFSDFSYILRGWSSESPPKLRFLQSMDLPMMNRAAKGDYQKWLMSAGDKKKILCAHFPMLEQLRHPNFQRCVYFLSEDDEYILDRRPDMILFGHTHWNIRAAVHDIPCYSNMYGYSKERGAIGFDQDFVITF